MKKIIFILCLSIIWFNCVSQTKIQYDNLKRSLIKHERFGNIYIKNEYDSSETTDYKNLYSDYITYENADSLIFINYDKKIENKSKITYVSTAYKISFNNCVALYYNIRFVLYINKEKESSLDKYTLKKYLDCKEKLKQ